MKKRAGRTQNELTAFNRSAATLREGYRAAQLVPAEFRRRLSRCSLSCKGMCCNFGVCVDEDTAEVLQELRTQRLPEFEQMGLNLPDVVVVGSATALKPKPFHSIVAGYPHHFSDTACVFLMEDGRCGLQALAETLGKHPWYYKPFGCCFFPIILVNGEIRLFDESTDPWVYPIFNGFSSRTFCGRTSEAGLPASTVLAPELDFLGRLLSRNLNDELAQAPDQRRELTDIKSSRRRPKQRASNRFADPKSRPRRL